MKSNKLEAHRRNMNKEDNLYWRKGLLPQDCCYGYKDVFSGDLDGLRLLLFREYARESTLINDLVMLIRSKAAEIAEAGKNTEATDAQYRQTYEVRLIDYVRPFVPDILLYGTFPQKPGSRFEEIKFRDSWIQSPILAAVDPADHSGCPPVHYPTHGAFFRIGTIQYTNWDQGRALIVGDRSMAIAKNALPTSIKEIACSNNIAVLVPPNACDLIPSLEVEQSILRCAHSAALNGTADLGLISACEVQFRTDCSLVSKHPIYDLSESEEVPDGGLIVLFHPESLNIENFAATKKQLHESFSRHPAVMPFIANKTVSTLPGWNLRKVNAALRALWAFRFVHQIPKDQITAFRNRFSAYQLAATHAGCARTNLRFHNKLKSHLEKAAEAKGYFHEIFPRAEMFLDSMWRAKGC